MRSPAASSGRGVALTDSVRPAAFSARSNSSTRLRKSLFPPQAWSMYALRSAAGRARAPAKIALSGLVGGIGSTGLVASAKIRCWVPLQDRSWAIGSLCPAGPFLGGRIVGEGSAHAVDRRLADPTANPLEPQCAGRGLAQHRPAAQALGNLLGAKGKIHI